MSNALAIAAVSEVLRSLVQTAAQTAVAAATARTGRPETVDPGEGNARVGVFLYQATPNPSWRNRELPTRRADGSAQSLPQAALDLHYLLTFFGDELDQEPERMLGAVVASLYAAPTLSRERVRQALPATHELGGTGLDRQVELVRFVPSPLTIDEMSKLWGMFVQSQYRLSAAYMGSVVLIEPEETVRPTLPVRHRNVYVELLERPVLDQVLDEAAAESGGPAGPIVFDEALVLRGRRLASPGTVVRVVLRVGDEEIEATPAANAVSATEIRVPLTEPPFPADGLRAGVVGVKVVHRRMMGEPGQETEHRGPESNLLAFVLHPRIAPGGDLDGLDVDLGDHVPPPPPPPPGAAPPPEPALTIGTEPAVGADQEAVLLLNGDGESHSIRAWRRAADADPLRFPVSGIAAGTYRLRVRIDGAESLLTTDDEGRYARPRVVLP